MVKLHKFLSEKVSLNQENSAHGAYLWLRRPELREWPPGEPEEGVPLEVCEPEADVEGGVLRAHEHVVGHHETGAAEVPRLAGKAVEPGKGKEQ